MVVFSFVYVIAGMSVDDDDDDDDDDYFIFKNI